MSVQKQSRVDLLEKRIKVLTDNMRVIIDNVNHLTTLATGTMQLIKQMPQYDEAIEKLKEKAKEDTNVE